MGLSQEEMRDAALQGAEPLTPEQREYWHGQAAYWCVKEEDALRALNYAHGQHAEALRVLGTENTINEGA